MQEIIIMNEVTRFWGAPRWQVIEVNKKDTGPGPIVFSPPVDTQKAALKWHMMATEFRKIQPHRVCILVLSPNSGPIENWLKHNWY